MVSWTISPIDLPALFSKGDVVAINLPNIPQYVIALAGTFKAGCVVSGASPLLTPKELVHQLNEFTRCCREGG